MRPARYGRVADTDAVGSAWRPRAVYFDLRDDAGTATKVTLICGRGNLVTDRAQRSGRVTSASVYYKVVASGANLGRMRQGHDGQLKGRTSSSLTAPSPPHESFHVEFT